MAGPPQAALNDHDMVADRLTPLCWLHNIPCHDDLGNPSLGHVRLPLLGPASPGWATKDYAASPTQPLQRLSRVTQPAPSTRGYPYRPPLGLCLHQASLRSCLLAGLAAAGPTRGLWQTCRVYSGILWCPQRGSQTGRVTWLTTWDQWTMLVFHFTWPTG